MRQKSLISQYLEHIHRKAVDRYPKILRTFVGRRDGIYVLFSKDRLYYVGLAKNLMSRLKQHLGDKHRGSWDSLSVYLTVTGAPLRELESLLLRVAEPKGNKQKGRLTGENLTRPFYRKVKSYFQVEADMLTGRNRRPSVEIEEDSAGRTPVLREYDIKRRKLRATLKGKTYKALILRDGRISFMGRRFTSPSVAASAITKRAMNGWSFWSIERGPGDWVKLDWLRKSR